MDVPARDPLRLQIRRRPGMYIGDVGEFGLRYLIDDIVTEQLAAPGASPGHVRCTIGAAGTYTVEVTGGVLAAVEPEDVEPDGPRYADGTRWGEARFFSLAIAAAVSERLEVEVVRGDGRRWRRTLAAGVPVEASDVMTTADRPRLSVRYRPDPGLFPAGTDAGFLPLCGRAREWATFHPSVRFTVADERDGQRRDFYYPAGLLSLAEEVEHQWAGYGLPRWQCHATDADGAWAEAVLLRHPTDAAVVYSFANGLRTLAGGSHVDGLRSGAATVAAALNPGDDIGDGPDDAAPADHPFRWAGAAEPLAGLTVLLAVRLDDPGYAGATKDQLADDRARSLVRHMIETADWARPAV